MYIDEAKHYDLYSITSGRAYSVTSQWIKLPDEIINGHNATANQCFIII